VAATAARVFVDLPKESLAFDFGETLAPDDDALIPYNMAVYPVDFR